MVEVTSDDSAYNTTCLVPPPSRCLSFNHNTTPTSHLRNTSRWDQEHRELERVVSEASEELKLSRAEAAAKSEQLRGLECQLQESRAELGNVSVRMESQVRWRATLFDFCASVH